MRRTAAALLVAALLSAALLSGGCWDRTEIEDTAYVVALGVDKAGPEFLWTFHIVEAETLPLGMMTPAPRQPDQYGRGLISVRAGSLEQAVQILQAGITRMVTLEQIRSVIFGEDLAREGLGPIIAQLLRHNQVRRGVGIAVAVGRGVDVLKQDRPVGEVNPAKIQEGLLLVQRQVHLSPPVRLQHFNTRLMAPGGDPTLPLIAVNPLADEPPGSELPPMGARSLMAGEFPRAGGNPVESAGSAVFRGDRLAGLLTVDETSAMLALRGEMGKVYNSIPDPDDPDRLITIRFGQENKPQYRVSLQGGRPVVGIKLQLEGEVLSVLGDTDYSQARNRRRLEEYAARHLKETNYEPLIDKVYNTWGADPAGLGHLFRHYFPTFADWMDYRWTDRVRDASISVEVELMIRRFGLLLENPAGHQD